MTKKKTIILILVMLLLIVSIVVGYLSFTGLASESRAKEYGIQYIHEEYSVKENLKVLNTCKPFFGNGGYHLVLQDTQATRYYIIVILGSENNLISVDDLTQSVWQGESDFPCEY